MLSSFPCPPPPPPNSSEQSVSCVSVRSLHMQLEKNVETIADHVPFYDDCFAIF